MCGIFGILTPSGGEPRGSATERLRELDALLERRPDPAEASAVAEGGERCLLPLSRALEGSFELVRRPGFLEVCRDAALRRGLEERLSGVQEWVRGLEGRAERGEFHDQRLAELANNLIVGGRDLAWRLERDVLLNVEPAARLLRGGEDAPAAAWRHAWQLNLLLNNIDRLEVRGRDSAGLAVYARFPSAPALDAFLAGLEDAGKTRVGERLAARCLTHLSLVRATPSVLLFSFKIAQEVGEMGSNVRFLREAIASDPVFQAALRREDADIQALAHTRWASNGVVSLPNCHPVDSAVYAKGSLVEGSPGALVAVLNGDVDNYQELHRRYLGDMGLAIDPEITTDAKIIPVVVGHHYRRSGRLDEAFREAFDEFEGSMAIGIMAADRPGEFLFAQKGSGQGLFLGTAGASVAAASEMYGLVEVTQDYLKAEGERSADGEMFRVRADGEAARVRLVARGGEADVPRERFRKAEITTRDINRGQYPRFLLKEISESVESARKTLRGKFGVDEQGAPRFYLGAEVLDPRRVAALREGSFRRIVCIGQGTAAIAADAAAHLLRRALAGARRPLEIASMKATELSAHGLRDDMSDTLVIAVSQSGTTTDTNRTVDLLKERGAWIIAIVNRRNSDLVYKSHGVLYTSDGRDVEMSVASTKAFYAQNVAAQILALALAEAVGSLSREELSRETSALSALPEAMQATLALSPRVRELAERHALRKQYWAVVGSGAGKIAADEIRIKLSELCYKSIASDFLEDKKHIDLSSEPLVLVSAYGTSPATLSDCVKEVSIFKAHRSIPLVIAEEGESRFDPYAAGVVPVPRYEGALSYLLSTMVGHLFGFHAASSFERHADLLRGVRARLVQELRPSAGGEASFDPASLSAELVSEIARLEELLQAGALDSGLRTSTAVRLSSLFQLLLGRSSEDVFLRQTHASGTAAPASADAASAALATLTAAVNELARPIDAIKHQAKTVTVGISRLEEPSAGALWSLVRGLGIPVQDLAGSHRLFLSAFEPLVSQVEGATLYRVGGLDVVGRPGPASTIRVEKKLGCALGIASRSEKERPLTGTKWGVVKTRDLYLGPGTVDGRRILIVPAVGDKPEGRLLLFHIQLSAKGDRAARLKALAAHGTHLERLKIAVTEHDRVWEAACIDRVDNEVLFLRPPEEAAARIVGQKEA